MTLLYLFRHGQAGDRLDYDRLSPLGCEQACLLGRYLAARGLAFDTCVVGGLERQQATARHVAQAYAEAGLPFPEMRTDTLWNEFDLDDVYARIAPRLAEVDPVFRRHYEDLRRDQDDTRHAVHRTWLPADIAVVDAWVRESIPYEGESFPAFVERIRCALCQTAAAAPTSRTIAVFTSGTPVAICAASAVEAPPSAILTLAGATINSAFTRFQKKDGIFRLLSFNETPHLISNHLQTHR